MTVTLERPSTSAPADEQALVDSQVMPDQLRRTR